MAMSNSSGNTSVTGSVTSTATIRNTSAVTGSITGTGAQSATLGTVGAGKKWRVITIQIAANTVSASQFPVYVKLNNVVYGVLRIYDAGQGNMSTVCTPFDYATAPQLAAGETITLSGTLAATSTIDAVVTYVEETA